MRPLRRFGHARALRDVRGGRSCQLEEALVEGRESAGARRRRWTQEARWKGRRRGRGVRCSLPDQPRDDAPVILVLHGLNGGSDEPYVRDLAQAAMQSGSVCACLVARGLMATPVRASLFHGGRTSDVGAAVSALKACFGDRVALIGISMGGIVAANYAARSGDSVKSRGVLCRVSNIVLGDCFETYRRPREEVVAPSTDLGTQEDLSGRAERAFTV